MATAVGPVKQTTTKYDAIVEGQLDRARKRIRALDLMTALLGFVAGTLAYALGMVLIDSRWPLPGPTLYAAFFVYLAGAIAYLGFTVVRPLTRRINPYFAARQVEQTLPGAKNSVVNWLDLHEDEKLPSAIQSALSQRAAKDIARVDLEKAVSGRRAGWAGIAVAVLVVLLLSLLFAQGARKLFSHLGRAFMPFGGGAPASQTELLLVEPAGDAVVAVNQPVAFRVQVSGRVPATVTLLTQPTHADPVQERSMVEDRDDPGTWVASVSAPDVKTGFYYRIVGGDASTPEYRIDVRSSPFIDNEHFTATYQRREYFGKRPPRVVRRQRDLKDYQGTRVTLDVPTNRRIRQGQLELLTEDNKRQTIPSLPSENEQSLRFQFVLEKSGRYVIRFTAVTEEYFSDPLPYNVTVLKDEPPAVTLSKPGKDETLPADALLQLEGVASDDIGVRQATLRMRVLTGETLQGKPYRSENEIRLADGGFPHVLDYKDFIDLGKVKNEEGKPVALQPGMVVEYWLEVRDACDQPKANVGESKRFKVTIARADRAQKKKDEERRQAEKQQREHEKQQDEKRAAENKERQKQDEQQRQANQDQKDEGKKKDLNQKGKEEGKDKKGKQEEKPKNGKDEKGKDEGKDGQGTKQKGGKDEENLRKKKEELEKAAREEQEKQRQREMGEGKDDKETGKRGEAKQNDQADGKDNKNEKQDPNGQGKGNPDPKAGKGQDKAKDAGKQPDQKRGEGKNEGQPDMKQADKAEGKDGAGKGNEQARGKEDTRAQKPGEKKDGRGQAKGRPEDDPQKGQDTAKAGGQKQPDQQHGEGKDEGRPDEMKTEKAAGKDAASGQPKDAQASGKKGTEKQPQRAEGKGQGKKDEKQQAAQDKGGQPNQAEQRAAAKDQGNQAGQQAKGQGKDDSAKPRGESKGKGGKEDVARGGGKPAPKEGDPQGGEKGNRAQEKSGGQGQAKDNTVAKNDQIKRDGQGENRAGTKPEQMRKEDVEQLARDLKSKDEQTREQARQKLEQAARKAKDAGAREQAKNELKKDERGENGNPATAKAAPKEPKEGKPGDERGAGKDGAPEKGEQAAKGKDGGPMGQQTAKGTPKDGSPKPGGDQAKGKDAADTNARKMEQLARELKQKKDARDEKGRRATEEEIARQFQKTLDDLKSGDPKRQEQARELLGELSRRAEKEKDLRDATPPEAAKKLAEQLAKDMEKQSPEERKKTEEALREMDRLTRGNEEARKAMNPEHRKKMEEAAKKGGDGQTGGSGGTTTQTDITNPDNPRAEASDGRHRDRAGNLTLEKLDKKALQELRKKFPKMTDEEFNRVVDFARQEAQKRNPVKEEIGKASGPGLPTTDIKRVTVGEDRAKRIESAGDGLPPLEYRDPYKDFTKRISEPGNRSKDRK